MVLIKDTLQALYTTRKITVLFSRTKCQIQIENHKYHMADIIDILFTSIYDKEWHLLSIIPRPWINLVWKFKFCFCEKGRHRIMGFNEQRRVSYFSITYEVTNVWFTQMSIVLGHYRLTFIEIVNRKQRN